jgi:hypothetical protein
MPLSCRKNKPTTINVNSGSCVLGGGDGVGRDICVHRKSFVLLKTFVCLATRLRSSRKNTMLQKSEDRGTEKERQRQKTKKKEKYIIVAVVVFLSLCLWKMEVEKRERWQKEFSWSYQEKVVFFYINHRF